MASISRGTAKLLVVGGVAVLLGYYFGQQNKVGIIPAGSASTIPTATSTACAPCTGIGGISGDIIVGTSIQPQMNPQMVAVF